ncbi:MAG: flagellar export chaperone FliS [Paludibaculum sp.]
MPIDVQDSYFESRILNADGVQLVQILYQAAIDSAQLALECLRQGDIAGRSKAISKAYEIITELEVSLNHEVGGAVSRGLAETYCYLRGRLLTANLEQSEGPLEEVTRLLRVIQEAWLACKETVPMQQEQRVESVVEIGPEPAPPAAQDGPNEWTNYSSGYGAAYPPPPEPREYQLSVSY